MPSLDDHFRALTKVRAPRSWPNLGEREMRPLAPPPASGRRLGVAALALIVAAAGLVFTIRAFRTEPPAPAPSSTVANGLIVFSRGGPLAGLYVMNPDGSGVSRLVSEKVDTDVAWSPDGSRIALVRGFVDPDAGIYVIEADGTGARRITDGGSDVDGTDLSPAWSPDGARIVFAREGRQAEAETGNTDLYVVDADGSGILRLTDSSLMEYEPAWSPDGSRIAFVGYDLAAGGRPPSPVRLYVMNADGTAVRALGPENVEGPAWSPDGSEIAFVDTETGSIMAVRPDGTGQRRIIDVAELVGGVHLVYGATWSPDGTKLAFMAGPDASDTHIYVVNRDGSGTTQLTEDPAPDSWPSWQPVETPVEATPVLDPHVTATIPVGSFPRDVAVGAGAVWVSVNDFPEDEPETHSVVRIDPETNEIVATIPVSSVGNLAADADAVWTIDSITGVQDALVRIDPVTNQIVGTIPVGSYAFDVAVGEGGVWVTRDTDGRGRSGEVIHVDPATNEVVARIPVQGRIRDVVVGEGGVWVVDSTSTLQEGSSLIHIDPETHQVVARTPELASLNVAAGAGLVWIQSWLSAVDPSVGTGSADRPLALRIDPLTDRMVGDPLPLAWFSPFAVGAGGVWFVNDGPAVARLNVETLEVDQPIAVGQVAQDSTLHAVLDSSTGIIWVANYQNTVTRIDLA